MIDIPTSMRLIDIREFGPADNLHIADAATPEPGAGEVLIKVASAGINRPDILQRQGNYAPPPGAGDVPGLEVAGVVAAVGSDCKRFAVGDEVCALVASGGYAEYCRAPEPQCLPIPNNVSLVEAGGLPETYFTVWSNLFQRGGLSSGETVLVHGGSSGIGTTAIQLARAKGARVITTVGSADKAEACAALGADVTINYREQDFEAEVGHATEGAGVDVILDIVGGDYVQRNINSLAVDGRLVQLAFLRGAKITANMGLLMRRRLTWTGSTLRPRSVDFKGAIAASLEAEVWPLFAAGKLKPVVHATFPLGQAAAAHRLMEGGAHIGKILLLP